MYNEPRRDQGLKSMLMRRWRAMGVTFVLVAATGSALVSLLPGTYQASAKLLMMRSEQRMGGLKVVNDAIPELTGASHPLYTQIELLRSTPVIQEVIDRLDLRDRHGNRLTPDDLGDKLNVSSIKGTDLIQVTFDSRDPVHAQRIVSTLCDAYLRQTETIRQQGVREGLRYLDDQLEFARKRLQDAERKLQENQARVGSISPKDEIQSSVSQLGELDTTIRQRRQEVQALMARAARLRSQLGMDAGKGLAAAALTQSPRLRSLQEQLVAAESSPLLTQGLASNHPDLVSLNDRIRMLRHEIRSESRSVSGTARVSRPLGDLQLNLVQQLTSAETDAAAAQAGLAAAEQSRRQLRSEISGLPALETQLGQLTRDVEVASQVYQELLQKREEARMNLSMAPTYVQVVEAARVPGRPLAPFKGQGVPVVLVLGLVSAFGVGSLKDLFDRQASPTDLATCLPELEIFATVPTLPAAERRESELVARTDANPRYLDALKGLSLALEDLLDGSRGRVIAMTSASTGEGKSVTLANLAVCLARAGHRVLLVDGDHRWPRVHELFGQPNAANGLSDVLVDYLAPHEVVRRAGEIDIVTAGSAKLTSSVLRLKHQLKPTLDAWREQYDFVLIDLPPLLMFAEVAHFARHTDGVLMLANVQRISPEALATGVQQLQGVRAPVIGMVAINQGATPVARPALAGWGMRP